MRRKLKRGIAWVLTVCMMLTGFSPAAVAKAAPEDASVPTLTVDMKADGRDLFHGATGWLYGLGDDQIPTTNTMTALKPHTAVQKAPFGMQHPDGDILDVADSFKNAGGKYLQVYVPDFYALWFYEFTGTDYYMDILKMEAQACIDAGLAEEAAYVLYNEPHENWVGTYHDDKGNTVTGWNSLYWFWKDMVEMLRDLYKENGLTIEPTTVGLNLAAYNNTIMDNYIKFCVEQNCMPDIISWHDLATWQFNQFGNEYNHYRGLEQKYLTAENKQKYGVDITPREIVINEYAEQKECAAPGKLVRWIGLWEDYEVAGCLPFWHLSNNLNGLAADTNEGNGAWWLYKWYGDMSGKYLTVNTSNANKSDFYGAASIDENKKSANVIFGGKEGSAQIVLDHLEDTTAFKGASQVHVKVERTDYTGFHGAAGEPMVVKEGNVSVTDGTAVIPMSDMLELSGYRVTVTQASDQNDSGMMGSTWKKLYEAENGTRKGSAAVANANSDYACSNRKKVNYIGSANDSVTLTVQAPKDGYYRYDMVYGAASGVTINDPNNSNPYTAIQTLSVDGGAKQEMVLPNTINWNMEGMYSSYLKLSAGSHTLTISGTDSKGSADVDCIYLSYLGMEEQDTATSITYEAELGEFNEYLGTKTALTTEREGKTGYITGLEKRKVSEGGGVRFQVVVPDNGMYTMGLRYASGQEAKANVYLDNDAVNLNNLRVKLSLKNTAGKWGTAYQTLFLQKGINVVDIDTEHAVKLDQMNISQTADSKPVALVEAESGVMTGETEEGTSTDIAALASNQGYVKAIPAANEVELIPEGDPDFTVLGLGRLKDLGEKKDKNSLSISVTVPADGEYKMAVYQSSGELFGKHSYNAQLTQRYAVFRVNGTEQKVVFRNTYSDETFRPQIVTLSLKAGKNTIAIFNDNSKVVTNGLLKPGQSEHRPENIDYGVLKNLTPNFDKFEFYAVKGETKDSDQNVYYKVQTKYSDGGTIQVDKTSVKKGDNVAAIFRPDEDYTLVKALADGVDITASLSEIGGVYMVSDIQTDVELHAIFEEKQYEAKRRSPYVYGVNAGDINPETVSQGDQFGSRNSVTDQFFAADKKTGYQWGVVDTYKENSSHPELLTGEKTWPCENDGADDASPKGKSFRYARDQNKGDVGIPYKFELEQNKTYDVELGFYVPSSWTNSSNPRTMKLRFNDTVVNNSFSASNDSDQPFVITAKAQAGADGFLTIKTDFADNAVWGPVISYISIMEPADKKELTTLVNACNEYKEVDYEESSYQTFKDLLTEAEGILNNADATMETILDISYRLELAKEKLKARADKKNLQTLLEQFKNYETETGQNMTETPDWVAFRGALYQADFIKNSADAPQKYVDTACEKLSAASEKLRICAGISITAKPQKTVYQLKEAFNPAGLSVTAADTKGQNKVLAASDYTLSGFSSDSAGQKTVTVSYCGKTAEFSVTVQKPVTVTLRYLAGKGGKVQGQTMQTVEKGKTAGTVKAVADKGYVFAKWSDGVKTASRTDKNVQSNKTLTAQFTKQVIPVSKVKVSRQKLTLGLKESYQLTASLLPFNATVKKLKWKSNSSRVSVTSKGKLTAKKAGKATITATAVNGKSAKCTVTVKKAPGSIKLNGKDKVMKKGSSFQLKVKLPNGSASGRITYTTSKKTVASVSAAGKVKALKKGKAVITAKTYNGKKARLNVTVK